jgi:hypothetical protein
MMAFFSRLCSSVVLFVAASTVHADSMYQCVDAHGHKTFSNVRLSSPDIKCTAMDLGPATTVPVTGSPASKPGAKAPSPAGFPKVGESDQKERDTDRRRILENELAAEQQNLAQAKKELAEQESTRSGDERNYQRVIDRLEPFKNKVALHERNIEAIQKELDKLR